MTSLRGLGKVSNGRGLVSRRVSNQADQSPRRGLNNKEEDIWERKEIYHDRRGEGV